jgi:hypothetical protein
MRVASFIVLSGEYPIAFANVQMSANCRAGASWRSYARNAQPATKKPADAPTETLSNLTYLAFEATTDIGLASRFATMLAVVAAYFLK